jgi:hypothetical protein
MLLRRWEVRTNSLAEGCTLEGSMGRFFSRRSAEEHCFDLNCWKLTFGYKNFNYYVHDRRDDG